MLAVRLTRTDNATMPSSSESASPISLKAAAMDRAKSFIRPDAWASDGRPPGGRYRGCEVASRIIPCESCRQSQNTRQERFGNSIHPEDDKNGDGDSGELKF
ncbi:hypothetical protein S23_20650 [Bradyrhizobium cosmicum]|uniref:Uncharacterized protein n=1 Tax=Bradyrhizobium cosmicum TaxID=1404864 RepID=A0AAI8QB68_9BRAD|nr:hypothetical protein S23_20650 [Bradyrhizobium cosmicum]